MWVDSKFPLVLMLGVTFYMDEITIRFKDHHAEKISMAYKAKGGDYRQIIFFIKDTHIKYVFTMVLCQKHIYLNGCLRLMLEG